MSVVGVVRGEISREPVLFGRPNAHSWLFPGRQQGADKSVSSACYRRSSIHAYHIIITSIQSRRIGHLAVHDPTLRIVLGPDKILDLPVSQKKRQYKIRALKPNWTLTLPMGYDRAQVSPPSICTQ